MVKKIAFITLGCKVNQYETNAMKQEFINEGYNVVEQNEKADIYIVNTCTVTNMSDRKSRQMLRRVKEINPHAIVVACGCYVQVAKEELIKIPEVELVLGNNEKKDIVKYIEEYIEKNQLKEKLQRHSKIYEVENVLDTREFVDFGDVTFSEKTRAVIKIQDGCDRFCSYCIIPYARGRVRSRKPESIISEIKKISEQGMKEVVITGIHIASYGKDFKSDYKLIDLLEEINQIDGIERIRLGSIEPLLITEEFVSKLIKLEKICHHFHLSLQSGCNDTLKRMNRRYTIEQIKKIVELLRNAYNDVILTTDIIVGFPGETDKEFNDTYKFLKEIKFYKMHVFKYSPRKGTKAAIMPNQIDGKIKETRSKQLIELSRENQREFHESYLGKIVDVLVEEKKDNIYIGHTGNYILIHVLIEDDTKENNINIENRIVKIKCIKAEDEYILGEM